LDLHDGDGLGRFLFAFSGEELLDFGFVRREAVEDVGGLFVLERLQFEGLFDEALGDEAFERLFGTGLEALFLFDFAFLVEDVEHFDLEGFEVGGTRFPRCRPGLDEAVTHSWGNRGGEGAGDRAEVLLADEVNCGHDGSGDLESSNDSRDRFEVDGIEAQRLGGDGSKGDGVAEQLAVTEADENGVADLHFGSWEVGVNRVGSTRTGVESDIYDPEGIHVYSLQFAVGSLQREGKKSLELGLLEQHSTDRSGSLLFKQIIPSVSLAKQYIKYLEWRASHLPILWEGFDFDPNRVWEARVRV